MPWPFGADAPAPLLAASTRQSLPGRCIPFSSHHPVLEGASRHNWPPAAFLGSITSVASAHVYLRQAPGALETCSTFAECILFTLQEDTLGMSRFFGAERWDSSGLPIIWWSFLLLLLEDPSAMLLCSYAHGQLSGLLLRACVMDFICDNFVERFCIYKK